MYSFKLITVLIENTIINISLSAVSLKWKLKVTKMKLTNEKIFLLTAAVNMYKCFSKYNRLQISIIALAAEKQARL